MTTIEDCLLDDMIDSLIATNAKFKLGDIVQDKCTHNKSKVIDIIYDIETDKIYYTLKHQSIIYRNVPESLIFKQAR